MEIPRNTSPQAPPNTCEPLVLSTSEVARRMHGELPDALKPQYPTVKKLAQEISRYHGRGGLNSYLDRTPRKNRYVTRAEAYRFMEDYYAGTGKRGRYKVPHTPTTGFFVFQIPKIFFPSAPLAGEGRRAKIGRGVEPIALGKCADGDTCKAIVLRGDCEREFTSLRFAGVDTPEKRIVAKFISQLHALLTLWKDEGLIGSGDAPDRRKLISDGSANAKKTYYQHSKDFPAATLTKNRMVCVGRLASLVMSDFRKWAFSKGARFFVEESYVRRLKAGDDRRRCDMANLYGNFLRKVAVVRVEPPSMIAEFIRTRLGRLMSTEGDSLLLDHSETTPEESAFLKKLRQQGRTKLYDMLAPKRFPRPSEMFSAKKTEAIAKAWEAFAKRHPDRAGDWNAALTMIGVAWPYLKYRNDLSTGYAEAGRTAKSRRFGLWNDVIFSTIDPSIHLVDKDRKVFVPFKIPPDCRTGAR